ncbi:MgtC/SapB family protein [Spirosoma sp. KUDC1026]|uniref:MgtC/SapB family protein n=1 Tax=Spirosoma sp. KUDC1026 TaxID=2745947 RepID=UPI00159BEB50|nr:MgtC/SapB family protein [Spirosoma sp. KUDC1026]QKZ11611.1 MgtC/SapB family protein [Spirosoma sp. KUDC1026]
MEFDLADSFRLVASLLMGGIIGAEREYHGKSAGFRTMIMISVGSTLFTLVSQRIDLDDSGRIAANIVNGIGFLGAGIIFRTNNRIKGLTTAATVWAVSALGMCLGAGYYDIALVGFIFIFVALILMSGLARKLQQVSQTREYRIVAPVGHRTLQQYEQFFREHGMSISRGQQQRIGNEIKGNWRVRGSQKGHQKCTDLLLNDPAIKEFTF